jgi:hypothetical protein
LLLSLRSLNASFLKLLMTDVHDISSFVS